MRPLVLIVDDEPLICRGIARALHGSFDVETASGYESAISVLDRDRELYGVISDLSLGGAQDGIQLLAEIHRRSPSTVRVLISGDCPLDRLAAAVAERTVEAFVPKPLETSALLNALRRDPA